MCLGIISKSFFGISFHFNRFLFLFQEPIEDNHSSTVEFEQIATEEVSDKQISRRMITETGDIIEAPVMEEDNTNEGEIKYV